MKEEALARHLQAIVKKHENWDEDFDGLTVHREAHFVELSYRDSGVGEDYVHQALRAEYDRAIDVDTEGGCDSCGYGRRVSITISGGTPPWEVVSGAA
jgi:hypothetical protein